MSVKVELVSGKVVCKVCSFHIGHTNDLGHLRLSSEIRLEIASQLQQGVTVSAVMLTMRKRFDSSLQRDNLLCRLVFSLLLYIHLLMSGVIIFCGKFHVDFMTLVCLSLIFLHSPNFDLNCLFYLYWCKQTKDNRVDGVFLK
jgi:hypothetical protein